MLEALGNLGDFVGGIAVVATLIYLAVQVRQNTIQLRKSIESARIEARDATLESFSRFRSQIIGNPDVAALYYRGGQDPESLTPEERLRFGMLLQELFSTMQGAVERNAAAGHPPRGEVMGSILEHPGVMAWWSAQKKQFRPEFVSFVETHVASGEGEDVA